MGSYYAILMFSQAIAFMVVAAAAVIVHAYLNVSRKEEECEISYNESEEEDERIQNVRLHQRHE